MKYLESAIELKRFIERTNKTLLRKNKGALVEKNIIMLSKGDGIAQAIEMPEFTNDFVHSTLKKYPGSETFVITDLATMDMNGQKLTYFLYKGYHNEIEKGLVYYQAVNENTMEPIGDLQFSNLEDNIFYKISSPNFEESTCNAMETDEKIEGGKSIVFFVGNLDEKRLVYDIQRLIFDTVNNVQKHKNLSFKFIINISKYNGEPSPALNKQIKEIETYTNKYIIPAYPNSTFNFEVESSNDNNPAPH